CEPIRVVRDRREIARTTAGRHRGFVNTVRAVLIEVVLHSRGDAAGTNCGKDARHAADVGQFNTGDVLTLAAEIVRRARAGPGVAGVVGKIQSGLRASDHVVTVVRIDAYFADGLILRKL